MIATSTTAVVRAEKPKTDQFVSKANEAIAIRPKRGRLTLLSRRIYNALLYHSQRQGLDEPVYRLPLAQLIGDARFNSNNTELLKAHLRDMQATTIEWSTSGAGQKRWVSSQLIGTISIDEPGPGRPCVISWGYPDEIRERLLRPNQYTKVMLEISARMRSYSAAVLYEIGARYLTSPGRLTMREDTIWWAAVLSGRSDIQKVDYRFFKRDVIRKALAEVEALCEEFSLELIEHRRGRRVEEMQFRVLPKAQTALDGMSDPAKNIFDLELVGRLIRLGLKQDAAQDLYAITDEGQLRAALELVEQRMKNKTLPNLKSAAAYLKDALKKGYAAPGNRAGEGGAVAAIQAPPPREEQLRRIREAWEADRKVHARKLYDEMPESQKLETRQNFETAHLAGLAAPIASAWANQGPASPIAGNTFYRWLAEATWPEAVSDTMLLAFALENGIVKFE